MHASSIALRLDEPKPGTTAIVHAASGGGITADVVSHASGNEHFARKQLGPVRYEDISVQVGSSMPSALFDWIAASWGATPKPRNGAIVRSDSTFSIRAERVFTGALIAETAFPALDAASSETGRLTIRMTPASTLPDTSPGGTLQPSFGKGVAKLWLASHFRLQVDGLDCTKVSRIEPFAVRRPIETVQGRGGGLRAGTVEFPNLRVTVAASSAASWFDWHRDFVVDGNNGDTFERAGRISLLSPNLTELARVELSGLGIFGLSTDPPTGGPADSIARVRADLYCERMALKPGGAP